jgi:hypothetical protein
MRRATLKRAEVSLANPPRQTSSHWVKLLFLWLVSREALMQLLHLLAKP